MTQTATHSRHSTILDGIRFFKDRASTPRTRSMIEFAEQELRLPPGGPFANRAFRTYRQPYSRLLLEALPDWARAVITGPTQSGKTLHAWVIPTMYHLFELEETVILGVPTMIIAKDKWTNDLLPAIKSSRYADYLRTTGPGSRGGIPELIEFAHGPKLRWMTAAGDDKQRAHFTSRVVIVTETDGFDEVSEASKEGQSKLDQIEGRTRAFGERAQVTMECTVSTNTAATWRGYSQGTASRIAVKCPKCKAWVTPERDALKGWQEADDEIEAGRKAYWACPECGGKWTEAQRGAMNKRPLLVHKGQEITAKGRVVGPKPRTNTIGFRWNAFNNLFQTTRMIAQGEWRAAHREDRAEAEKEQKQQVWCVPVEEDHIERSDISGRIVRGAEPGYHGRCTGLARGVVPEGTIALTAFVDVHSRRDRLLYYSVRAWLTGRRRVVVDYGQAGNADLLDKVGPEKSVLLNLRDLAADWRSNPYCSATAAVPFDLCLVDCSYLGDTIHEFLLEWGEIRPAHASQLKPWAGSEGAENFVECLKPTRDKRPPARGTGWFETRRKTADGRVLWTVTADVDRFKHVVHDAFLLPPTGDGSGGSGEHLPGAVRLCGERPDEHFQYGEQITAEVFEREFDEKRGWINRWIKKRKENHWLDCEAGNELAGVMTGAIEATAAKPVAAVREEERQESRGWFARQTRRSGRGKG